MHTHYVRMDGRFHHAASSRQLCEQFVQQMTVGWDEHCQACGGTKELPALTLTIDGRKVTRPAGTPCEHCADGPKPGPRFGSIELAYDPGRFEIGALSAHVVTRNGVPCEHTDELEDAQHAITRFVDAHVRDSDLLRRFDAARRPGESPEDCVYRIVSSWYAVKSLAPAAEDGSQGEAATPAPDAPPPAALG